MAETNPAFAAGEDEQNEFHSTETDPSYMEGDIHIPGVSEDDEEFNTLDEPVSETLVS